MKRSHCFSQSVVTVASLTAALVSGCAVDPEGDDLDDVIVEAVSVSPRSSLMVTDRVLLEHATQGFQLQRVLDQFAAQSSVAGMSGSKLFRQLWDTFNVAPGLGLGPNCNSVLTNGLPSTNGYPVQCPRAEGAQTTASMSEYTPIAVVNRFDLADSSDRPLHCGEYRIVYGRGVTTGSDRNLIIFEGKLPNPNPAAGRCACAPVVRFWQDLAAVSNLNERAARLHNFYFNGLPGFRPIVHINNFGLDASASGGGYASSPTGQVRTNSFIDRPRGWNLREFKLALVCRPQVGFPRPFPLPLPQRREELLRPPVALPVVDLRPQLPGRLQLAQSCTLRFVPVSVKTNPEARLFNASLPGSGNFYAARAAAFQAAFPTTVPTMAVNDVNAFSYDPLNVFNAGESPVTGAGGYLSPFSVGGAASPFRAAVQARLTAAGSALTPENIVRRAEALSCQGCHQSTNNANLGGGVIWPPSLGFVHVSDTTLEPSPLGGQRWVISPALASTFLPARQTIMEKYLNVTCRPFPVPLTLRRPLLALPLASPFRSVRALVSTTELTPVELSVIEPAARPTLSGRTTH